MESWWKNYPWRMIQPNLREIDMADLQKDLFVQNLKDLDATVVLMNVGGILASYPSRVEDHTVSSYLTGSSLLEIIEACHKEGIRVLARMDFSKIREEVYLRHPDWAFRSKDGEIINYNGDVHACLCGDYGQKKSFEIMEEVLRSLPIDGIFFNMGGFKTLDYSYRNHGFCHCENCRKKFKEFSGLEIPDKEDWNDPAFLRYKDFQDEMVRSTNKRLYSLIHSIRPDILIGGLDFIRTESKTEYRREKAAWPYQASSIARGGSSVEGGPLISNASVDFIGFLYRHNSVGAERMELRMNQDIANYCGLDYYIIGRLDNHLDRTSYAVAKDRFAYMKRHEKDYQNMQIYSEVLLIRLGGNGQLNDESRGWISALTESHIPFGEVGPAVIKEDTDISRFKAIIIPDQRVISTSLAAKLDKYCQSGGTLILSGATQYWNEHYHRYQDFPFPVMADTRIKRIEKNQISGLLRIQDKDKALFPSLADTDILYYGDDYALCEYPENAETHLNLIPPHPFGPPERCYFTKETNDPGYVVFHAGKGQLIYIPWNPGKNLFLDGYRSTYCFMKDLILSHTDARSVEDEPFTPMVEVTIGRSLSEKKMMIHLVNTTGCFGQSYCEPVPVENIQLSIPSEEGPEVIEDMETGEKLAFRYEEKRIHLTVSRLEKLSALNVRFQGV